MQVTFEIPDTLAALALIALSGLATSSLAQQPPASITRNAVFHPDKRIHSISVNGPTKLVGDWYEGIENHNAKDIDAIYVDYHCKVPSFPQVSGSGKVIYDTLTAEHGGVEVAPGGRNWFRITVPPHYSQCSVHVDAIVFTDGSGEGNAGDRDAIYQHRSGVYQALNHSVPLVQELANGQATLPEVLKKLDGYRSHLDVQIYAEASDGPGDTQVPIQRRGYALGGGSRFPPRPGYGAPLPDPETGWYTRDEVDSIDYFYARLESALSGSPAHPGLSSYPQFPWRSSSSDRPNTGQVALQQSISPAPTHAVVLSQQLQRWQAALQGVLKPSQRE